MNDHGSYLSTSDVDRLTDLLHRCAPGPWIAVVEGRDQDSGASFIQTGPDGRRGDDLYVTRSPAVGRSESADSDLLDLVALMRTSMPLLLREVREHRTATPGK